MAFGTHRCSTNPVPILACIAISPAGFLFAEEATELASINQSIERLRKQAELLSAELDATDAAAEADSALADDAEAAAVRQCVWTCG